MDRFSGRGSARQIARQKTFSDPAARQSILARISTLAPDSPRRWGVMSAHQMLCHLADSYRTVIGEKKISAMRLPVPQSILKWVALRSPFPWPHNAPTRPEVQQGVGGTPPVEFESDRAQLIEVIERFCSCPDSARTPHPVFRDLSPEDWMRWGYLHADHHLRQFSR